MLVRRKTTAIVASGLLVLGAAACEGQEAENPAGSELDTDADGPDNGVQPDGQGPETYDDPVFGEFGEDGEDGEQPDG